LPQQLFPLVTQSPQSGRGISIWEDLMMTVTHTMTMTLLATGSLSFYLILHAAIDVLRQRRNDRD
jgi:hypothetical protein